MSSNSSGNLFVPNERGPHLSRPASPLSPSLHPWWSDADLALHLVRTGRVRHLVGSRAD